MSKEQLEHTNGTSPSSNQEILERLRERASATKEGAQREVKKRFLIFQLDTAWFAADAKAVREISRLGTITPVPLTREYIVGVVNLRGNVTAVIDVRGILGLNRRKLESSARIVVLVGEGLEAGILADAVAEVVEVPERTIEPALLTLERDQAMYIMGNFKLGERNISILNPVSLLLNLKI